MEEHKRIGKDKLNKIRIEKVIKRKGDKLYVKWKGYDNNVSISSDYWKLIHLSYLKSNIDKLDIDKLEASPVNLSKLSEAVKYDLVKRLYHYITFFWRCTESPDNLNLPFYVGANTLNSLLLHTLFSYFSVYSGY